MVKRLIFFGLILCTIVGGTACSQAKYLQKHATSAHIQFKTDSHNFGEVIFAHPAEYSFHFTNTGSDTLRIKQVQSTCGCTIPKWSKEPVPPGGKGVINVSYDTMRSGDFEKGITVFTNADNSAVLLVISGTVTTNPNKVILGKPLNNDSSTNSKESINSEEQNE